MLIRSIIVLALTAHLAFAESTPVFAAIPASSAAGCYTLTEDGRNLLLGHPEMKSVSVWDSATRAPVTSIPCSAPPEWILCRGDKAFVAQEGGLITVIDTTSWKILDELDTHLSNIYYLSAPQGRFFTGTIFATAGTYPDFLVAAVDTKADSTRTILKDSLIYLVTLAYNGTSYIRQQHLGSSPGGLVSCDRTSELLAGRGPKQNGEHVSLPFIQQFQDCDIWVGGPLFYAGMPPRMLNVGPALDPEPRSSFMRATIDRAVKRAYVITNDQVYAYALSLTMPRVGSARVEIAKEDSQPALGRFDNIVTAAESVTIDGRTHLFARSQRLGIVVAATVVIVEGGDAAAAVASVADRSTAAVGAAAFPARVAVGAKIAHRLVAEGTTGTFTVMAGPPGLAVDSAGLVTWTPETGQAGTHQVKIRGEVSGATAFYRFSCEVLSAAVVAAAGGDPERVAQMSRHPVVTEPCDVSVAIDGRVLIHQGRSLEILDAAGLTASTLELTESYEFVRHRGKHLVACMAGTLDLLDPTTGKLLKHIALPGRAIHALELNPRENVCYASCDLANGQRTIEQQRVVVVDESTGNVTKPERLYGRMICVHPSGKLLFTAIKDIFVDDVAFVDAYGDLRLLNRTETLDLLMSFDLGERAPRLRHIHRTPGVNGSGIVASGDGRFVSYVSGGGYRQGEGQAHFGYTVPAFTCDDIRKADVSFDVGSYPHAIAYHPSLPLVAASNGKTVVFFEAGSGVVLAGKCALPEGVREVYGLWFARGGERLLVDHRDATNLRVVQTFPLTLDEGERKLARAGSGKVMAPSQSAAKAKEAPAAANVTLADIDALGGGAGGELKPADIAKRFESAVVLLESKTGSATGFIVGKGGLVLTCAHGLPQDQGAFSVRYRTRQGQDLVAMKDDHPQIIRVDEHLDLALVRIKPLQPCTSVRIPLAGAAVMGERVYVIGNPGGGGSILDSTMTEGLISNPKRRLEDQDYLQTSAAVNPGSSGSPLFNAKGEVLGLVVLKAMDAEAAAFAVPRETLVTFLRSATGGATKK